MNENLAILQEYPTFERLPEYDNVKCAAPRYKNWRRLKGRCNKPLVKDAKFYLGSAPGRACADGHISLTCPKCHNSTFTVVPEPRGYHETWMGSYYCRACGECITGDEGCDTNAGEVI